MENEGLFPLSFASPFLFLLVSLLLSISSPLSIVRDREEAKIQGNFSTCQRLSSEAGGERKPSCRSRSRLEMF